VEWTLYFQNTGDKDTPLLADICPLDIEVAATAVRHRAKPNGEFRLHHHIGSPCSVDDYRPLETILASGTTKRITAAGGRPTNSDLSYFNVQRPGDGGLIIVIGWPGQWAANFQCGVEAACESGPVRKQRG
jgi:alpha-galactosidase